MSTIQSVLLGLLQGFTEFLPISSDGHLTLLEKILGTDLTGRDFIGFTVVLHAGSLIALLICYRQIWLRLIHALLPGGAPDARRLIAVLIVATIPGVIAGLLFEDLLATMFRSLFWLGIFWLVTAALLWIGERQAPPSKTELTDPSQLKLWQAGLIGVSQAAALLPSLSRSGTTVSVGRMVGLSRQAALDFSFLMAAPILGGATLLVSRQIMKGTIILPALPITLSGFIASLLTSIVCVTWLRRFVAKAPLSVFNWYLVPLGIVSILWGIL